MSKTILVTGAASGFGRGVAWGLARNGHKVIAGCQIWPQVCELRNAAKVDDVELHVIKLDVLNEIDRAKALGFEIDVLFNNAGIMESGPIVEIPMSVFRSVFETNVFAALELAQGFARVMVKRGSGRIVWTSSVAGSMFAKTMKTSASWPLVIQSLRPVMENVSRLSVARVVSAKASLPEAASDSA